MTPRKPPTTARRPASGAIDAAPGATGIAYDAEGRIVGSAIRLVQQQHVNGLARTRERAAECRTLLAGDLPLVMPKGFKLANADAFAADLPTTYTRAAELLSLLLQKRCDLKRFQTTGSQRAKDTSTDIERIVASVMEDREHGYGWAGTCDIVQNDALCCVITQPMPTFWDRAEGWQDPDTTTFKAEYQRDKDGRTRAEAGAGFRANGKKSKQAYQDYLDDYKATHPPVLYRELGPEQITVVWGPRFRVDAVIVSGRYQRTHEMPQQFAWGEDAHLSPVGGAATAAGGAAPASPALQAYGEVEILEYWGYRVNPTTRKREPYVSYCVNGAATTWADDGSPAVYDLSKYCSRLPVAVEWGQHWPGASHADQRALPFMWPFLQSARQANAIATGIAVALWWAGFPTYVVDRTANKQGLTPTTKPLSIDIEPLKLIETDGPVTRLQGGDVSRDATMMLQLLLGENEKAAPPQQASGKGDSSGFEKTIARAYAEDAQFMILEGIRRLYEQSASFTLEILSNIAKETGRPVPVYYSGDVLSTEDNDRTSSTRVLLELTPDLAGGQYKLSAEYPKSMSLAERQQSAELVERRLKTRRKHFEDDGDPAPDRTAAEIEAEDLVSSEIGQSQRWELVARILGDDQMAEKVRLMQQQKISQLGNLPFSLAVGFEDILAKHAAAEGPPNGGQQAPMPQPMTGGVVGPGGMPGGAVPPGGMPPAVQPGMPQGGQMTGLGGPSTAQASLAGAVGGEMSAGPIAHAAAAGGAIPPGLGG